MFARHARASLGVVLLLTTASVSVAQTGSVTLVSQEAAIDTVAVSANPYLAHFTVRNAGADSATYSTVCTALGAVACAGGTASSVRLGPGQQATLNITYRATRAGRGLVVLRVRDPRSGTRASAALLLTVTGS